MGYVVDELHEYARDILLEDLDGHDLCVAAAAEIVALERRNAELEKPDCHWRVTDTDIELWESSCGGEWVFNDGPPGFDMKYCPRCGGRALRTQEES